MSDLRIVLPATIDELAEEIEHQADRIVELEALTEADGKEIGSYRDGTGLRGENRAMMDRIAELEAALNKLRIWCSEEPSLSSTDIIELLEALEQKDE